MPSRVNARIQGLWITAVVPDIARQIRRSIVAVAAPVRAVAITAVRNSLVQDTTVVGRLDLVGTATELQHILHDAANLGIAQHTPQAKGRHLRLIM